MALEPTPKGVASLRDAMHAAIPSTEDVTFDSCASPANTGMTLAAEAEQRDSDPTITVMTALAYSPVFWLAIADYKSDIRKLSHLSKEERLEGKTFALRLLCARMFQAGRFAERESGRAA